VLFAGTEMKTPNYNGDNQAEIGRTT